MAVRFGFDPWTIRSGPSCRDAPFNAPVIPSAWQSRAGPAQSGSAPRRRRIVCSPAMGSSARIKTAAGKSCGSVTAFKHQCIPYVK